MNSNRDQDAELWLTATLKRYSAAEPSADFDPRLLSALASSRRIRSRWVLYICASAAALVLLSVGLVLWKHLDPHPEISARVMPTPAFAKPITSSVAMEDSRNAFSTGRQYPTRKAVHSRTQVERVADLQPRRSQFPSPTPMSKQEKLLRRYVAVTPHDELLTVMSRQQQREEDLRNHHQTDYPATMPAESEDWSRSPEKNPGARGAR